MKIFLLLVFFFAGLVTTFSQTEEQEKEALYQKILSKEISQLKYATSAKKWQQLLDEVGGYPDLPLNEDSLVWYTYVSEFPELSQSKLYNRTLEWLAVSYGVYPSFIYSNKEDGRIIFDNSFKIDDDYSGYYTGIITVIDGKVVVEFVNISYQAFFQGHYSGDVWVLDRTINVGINEAYPVILKDQGLWRSYLRFFKTTNKQLFDVVASLRQYHYQYERKLPLR